MIGGSTSLNLAHAAIGNFMQACKNSAMHLALMTLVRMVFAPCTKELLPWMKTQYC